MSNFVLATPVALIIFNRPETTERVFAEIAKARPPKLLVVGDGPRLNRAGELEKVNATRAIIEKVDWECEVLTNFSEVNLGCKKRVSSGIDWIFEEVEEAIILEDDCLPGASFFRYCEELLVRYREDKRVGMISGDNFQFGREYGADSYYFSKFVHIWGWASWRDRWQNCYDVDMGLWPVVRDQGRLVDLVGEETESRYWFDIFERVYKGEIDTWDYQWGFANWIQGRICIIPSVNLISNIGFGVEATHTFRVNEFADMPVLELSFPLIHPVGFIRNLAADRITSNRCYRSLTWRNILVRAKSWIRMRVKI